MEELKPLGFEPDLPIEKIEPISDFNVRTKAVHKGLEQLAASIEHWGVLQPISVIQKDGTYELFVGQRRYLASLQARRPTIPAIVYAPMSKSAARLRSISENVQRRALDPDDTGEVFYELYQQEKNLGRVAELLGVSVPTVTKYLGYRTLPTWLKEAVLARGLTVAKAVRLWNFSQHDEAKAKAIVERMPSMTKNEIDRLLILYEANPEEDPDQLVEKARKEKYLPRIIIHLPPRYALGLSNAAADTDREPEDIARRAVMDWLEENGYV
jgi:ParB family chromosome partitioning protein